MDAAVRMPVAEKAAIVGYMGLTWLRVEPLRADWREFLGAMVYGTGHGRSKAPSPRAVERSRLQERTLDREARSRAIDYLQVHAERMGYPLTVAYEMAVAAVDDLPRKQADRQIARAWARVKQETDHD